MASALLSDGDEEDRYQAAIKLYQHPEQAVVSALSFALRDESVRVRGCVAESLRCIAENGGCRIDPKPILEVLWDEDEESEAHHLIIVVLREIGAGADAEHIIEKRRKSKIVTEGGHVAEKLQEMEQNAVKLCHEGNDFESAFAAFFDDLENESAVIRSEASRQLAENQRAVRKLINIFQENSQIDPRKSVLAGRVLGRRIDAGKQEMVHSATSYNFFGIKVAFTPCVCGFCNYPNVGIPVPEGGLNEAFYSQQDDKNCVYSLPVLCDHCGKQFFITWDRDPR